MQLTERQLENFWKKVDKNGPIPEHNPDLGRCWVWTASTQSKGYGQIKIAGVVYLAHRVSFALHCGYVPANFVLHSCDNPSCVNPFHLREGTHCENMRDLKERRTIGVKLTRQKALAIRRAEGTHREIADRHGVSHRTVGQIKNCITWNA